MTALATTFETSLLKLLFQNIAMANIGDASGLQPSAIAGSFYVGLATSDPGEAGSIANECAYTSYARVAVARSSSEWAVVGDEASNINPITFPAATGGSETATHWFIATGSTGANIVWYGALDASLAISSGITPQCGAGLCAVTVD